MKRVWSSVDGFIPHELGEGGRAVVVDKDGSIYLFEGGKTPTDCFRVRFLHDRCPDFGMASFLTAGDEIGWPNGDFTEWVTPMRKQCFVVGTIQNFQGHTPSSQPAHPIVIQDILIPILAP